jgi:hypothetical protein
MSDGMTHPTWRLKTPDVDLGVIPLFLDDADPDPAAKQIDKNYQHGGGWNPMKGFTLDDADSTLSYPGDPPMRPIAVAKLRDELIFLYPYAFVCIRKAKGGTFEVGRVD